MNYIINPICFYVISILNNISKTVLLVIIIALIVFILAIFRLFYLNDDYLNDDFIETRNRVQEEKIVVRKAIKGSLITMVVCIALVCFIPSDKACYNMLIASQVTDENVNKAENIIKDSVDYIFEKLGDE